VEYIIEILQIIEYEEQNEAVGYQTGEEVFVYGSVVSNAQVAWNPWNVLSTLAYLYAPLTIRFALLTPNFLFPSSVQITHHWVPSMSGTRSHRILCFM